MANEDFVGYTRYRIYVFSVYWVCTVITTVGYGDYSGGTTLEYCYTMSIEFFGMILFASIQIAVQQVIDHNPDYEHYVHEVDQRINEWLLLLESSNFSINMPSDLHETVKQGLWQSFRCDNKTIINEYNFYQELSPKLQNELVQEVFGKIISRFSEFFTDCEQQFINNLIMNLSYNTFEHG